MNPVNEQIKTMMAMLRAQGGVVGINPDAPDDVKQAFLEIILDCPDCREAMLGKHDGRAN